jgi:hypothetical protein
LNLRRHLLFVEEYAWLQDFSNPAPIDAHSQQLCFLHHFEKRENYGVTDAAVVNSQELPESFFFCVVHGGKRMRRGGGYGETLGKGKRVRSF